MEEKIKEFAKLVQKVEDSIREFEKINGLKPNVVYVSQDYMNLIEQIVPQLDKPPATSHGLNVKVIKDLGTILVGFDETV